MNKNIITNAVMALCAMGFGAGIGSYFTYKNISQRYKEQYENELAIIKNDFSKKMHKLNEELKDEKYTNEFVKKDNSELLIKAMVSKTVDDFMSDSEEEPNNEEYDKEVDEELEDEYEFVEEDEPRPNKQSRKEENVMRLHDVSISSTNNAPYILNSSAEFGEIEGYALSSLTYYTLNDVLVDEDNEVLQYPSFIIGTEAMEVLKTTNLPAIYVRDDVGCTDYEVMICYDTDFYES